MVATTSVSRKTDYLQVLSSCRELPPETEVCVLKTGSTGNRHSHCEGNTNSNLKKENVQLESKKNDLLMAEKSEKIGRVQDIEYKVNKNTRRTVFKGLEAKKGDKKCKNSEKTEDSSERGHRQGDRATGTDQKL